MDLVQEFQPSDISGVAELFMNVFREHQGPAPESLRTYLSDLYFGSPVKGERIPSYVSRSPSGEITGFIGALQLTMLFHGRKVVVAVAGNHMVDPAKRDPFAGPNLLKRFLQGPQELTYTDTANEISRRLWQRMGAQILPLHSLRWLRIVRPATYPLSLIRQPVIRNIATLLVWPFKGVGNVLARPLLPPPDRRATRGLREESFDPDRAADSSAELEGPLPLRPLYDRERLSWLLRMAAQKQQYGPLEGYMLYEDRRLLGWCLYYARRGQTAEVLHLVAHPTSFGKVLNSLMVRAEAEGCSAVSGLVNPNFLGEYHKHHGIVFLRNMYAMTYSKNSEILNTLLAGQASLSRLEGEWWTRLQGDRFA